MLTEKGRDNSITAAMSSRKKSKRLMANPTKKSEITGVAATICAAIKERSTNANPTGAANLFFEVKASLTKIILLHVEKSAQCRELAHRLCLTPPT